MAYFNNTFNQPKQLFMKNKALLVGINQYPNPGNNLRGCINDIMDMEYCIAEKNKVYPKENIKKLTNQHATKKGIIEQIHWLIEGVVPGDQILFHYSGHGAQLPTQHHQWEKDGLDEIICPYDFDGRPQTALSDKEFAGLFAQIPAGVHFVWISDSCHAQDLSRDPQITSTKGSKDTLYRTYRGHEAHQQVVTLASPAPLPLHGALLSACTSEELSADAYIDHRFNGAFTHYLIKNLNQISASISMETLIKLVNKDLERNGYDQNPQSEGLLDQQSFFQ